MNNANNRTIDVLNNNKSEYGIYYYNTLLEQYKLYVEMADRISSRRMLANSFFLGINTAVISAIGIIYKDGFPKPSLWMIIPFITLVTFCYIWWRIIKSYRQLNTGKYDLIGKIEEYLPLSLYKTEWSILGSGKNNNLCQPITHIENWVPIFFGIVYVTIATVFMLGL